MVKINNNYINILSKTLFNSFALLFQYHKIYLIYITFITIIQGFLPVISLLVMQDILNLLQSNTDSIDNYLYLIAIYILIEITSSIIITITTYIDQCVSYAFDKTLSMKFMDKVSDLDLKDFENSDMYDILNRAQGEGNSKILGLVSTSLGIINLLITSTSYIIILSKFNPMLVLVIIVIPSIRYFFFTENKQKAI